MKFINRQNELRQLDEFFRLSRKGLITIAVSGLRKVGKTTLIKEFIKGKKSIYFFVYESKTSLELLLEFGRKLKEHKIISELEEISTWSIFMEVIFKRCAGYVVVFDEFQNFYYLDKAVFSIMQRYCDENKEVPINIVILGSLIGLFKKVFEDKKQPLYGRISAKLKLNPFTLKDSIEMLQSLGYKDAEQMLRLYGLFGGFPKYYSSIEQFDLVKKDLFNVIEYLFIQENAPLESEVQDILKQEFGRRSSLYYGILHSIAIGKTKLNEIAAEARMKESSITRHLSELDERFGLITSIRAMGNKKSTRYHISHPLISFWFRFVYTKFSEYALRDTAELMGYIKLNFDSFFGRRFEEISKEFLSALNAQNKLPFKAEYINNWWGSTRIDGERKEVEIDLIATNRFLKSILFVECKWKEKVDANLLIQELKEKSKSVAWNNDKRKEYYCIIAKSFKKKISDKGVLLFTLKNIKEFEGGKDES